MFWDPDGNLELDEMKHMPFFAKCELLLSSQYVYESAPRDLE